MSLRKSLIDHPALGVMAIVLILVIGLAQPGVDLAERRSSGELLHDVTKRPATVEKCVDCHTSLCESFSQTGHARTLHHGSFEDTFRRFAGQESRWPSGDATLRFIPDGERVWLIREGFSERLPIEWLFGSGHHAQTPVAVMTNPDGATEMRQHSLTWYSSYGLAPTLGRDGESPLTDGMNSLGSWLGTARTEDCFGCHSTYLPMDENRSLLLDQMIPGVTCARCHFDASRHVAANGAVGPFLEKWSHLSPLDAVNRCGECHRRADHTTPGELEPNRTDIIRFAPIGFAQSKCFTSQDKAGSNSIRFTCTTCHDPHSPVQSDPEPYRQVCLKCHDMAARIALPCRVEDQQSNCLRCHMPTVETDPHLNFTDHWIRVRRR